MNLPINILLHELSCRGNEICCYPGVEEGARYSGMKVFTNRSERLDRENIYFLEPTEYEEAGHYIEEHPHGGITFLAVVHNRQQERREVPEGYRVIAVYTDASYKEVFNRVLNIFCSFQDWEAEIKLAVIRGGTMQQLADCTEKVLHYPFVIFDLSLNVLGYSKNIETQNKDFLQTISQGYNAEEKLDEMMRKDVNRRLLESDLPCQEPCSESPGYYNIYFRIGKKRELCGFVTVYDYPGNPQKQGFFSLLELVEENFTLYYQRNNDGTILYNIFDSYIADILDSGTSLLHRWKEQEKYLLELKRAKRFILCKLVLQEIAVHELAYIRNFVSTNLNVYPFIYNHELYLLKAGALDRGSDEFFSEYELLILQDLLGKYEYCLTQSSEFFEIENLRMAYEQCRVLSEAAKDDWKRGKIYEYAEYSTRFFMRHIGVDYLHFLTESSGYGRLHRYDRENHTDYCRIYYTYQLYSENMSETAKRLDMHRNTLLKRLKNIEEILGKRSLLHKTTSGTAKLDILFLLSYDANRYLERMEAEGK